MMSFWIVLEWYVAFLGPLAKWFARTLSPASTLKLSRAWKFPGLPEDSSRCDESLRWPRNAMFCLPQSTTVLMIDRNFCLLSSPVLRWISLSCSEIDSIFPSCTQRTSSAQPAAALWNSELSWCSLNFVLADTQFFKGLLYSLSRRSLFFPVRCPNKTQKRQNAPSWAAE